MPEQFLTRRAVELAAAGVEEIHYPIRPCDVVVIVAVSILGLFAAALLIVGLVVLA